MIYAIVSPPQPIIKRVSEQPSRTLAYEQQISHAASTAPAAAEGEEKPAAAPADQPTVTPAAPTVSQAAPAKAAQDAAKAEQSALGTPPADASQPGQSGAPRTAALPPQTTGEDAGPYDPDALPWQRGGRPYYPASPGEGPEAYDPSAAPPVEDGYPADPNAALPGENDDPNAWPAGPQQEAQEWVQVLVSGAGMYGAASEDAPALFVFPYGRPLRVVSRYGNWVEVTDPQSAATGWMKAQYLAPMAAPRPPEESDAWYNDEPPRRRGWFRRHSGGLADMINRALGGY